LLQLNKDYDRRNFVDYVIFVSSGKGGKGSTHYTERNLLKKEVLMEEMEVTHVVGNKDLDFISPKICTSYQSG
jgi:hypothetical protein